MADFTAKDVQALREATGIGMMECKKALTEAGGDFDAAVTILRERGLASHEKKAGRITSEGIVSIYTEGDIGAIIEVNSETDFVAKNEDFRAFVTLCAKTVVENDPKDVEALLACEIDGVTLDEILKEKVFTIGENLKIRRFERFEGIMVPYIHGGGTHAVLVKFESSAEAADSDEFILFGKDIAMQIAAANPTYLTREDMPSEAIEQERAILMSQALNEGKPQNIAEKMVEGRINKYYKDVVLLEQPFVKDDKMTVAQYVASVAKALGEDIKIVSFTRYEKGEGLEKRSDNFAEEVANMQK
ncbi:MAG: translation elongation factor Ts [Oscillospiraceae bacterium]|nr:translation elongation factor Ts [Oscillospiraceae bacterium]